MKALLLKMTRLMAETLKELNYPWRYAHIRQKFHAVANSSGWTISSASHAA